MIDAVRRQVTKERAYPRSAYHQHQTPNLEPEIEIVNFHTRYLVLKTLYPPSIIPRLINGPLVSTPGTFKFQPRPVADCVDLAPRFEPTDDLHQLVRAGRLDCQCVPGEYAVT